MPFRKELEKIIAHKWRPIDRTTKGATCVKFRCTWKGFDIESDESLEFVLDKFPLELKKYLLRRCPKKALKTLVIRCGQPVANLIKQD